MDKIVIIRPESGLQFDWKSIAENPIGNHKPFVDLLAYKTTYINSIAQARARGQEPILVSLPIMDEDRFFAFITRGMTTEERMNILFWLGGKTARLRNIHEMYNLTLFRLAAQQCVHIVDITSPMLSFTHYDELLEPDGISLSPAGEKMINDACFSLRSREPYAAARAAFLQDVA